jgi:hypothetical protein
VTLTSSGRSHVRNVCYVKSSPRCSFDLPRPEADALARAPPKAEAALSGAPPPRGPHPPPSDLIPDSARRVHREHDEFRGDEGPGSGTTAT